MSSVERVQSLVHALCQRSDILRKVAQRRQKVGWIACGSSDMHSSFVASEPVHQVANDWYVYQGPVDDQQEQ
jgi:hypothetical protein